MSATINRSLTNIRTELEFLLEEGVITDALYQQLTNALPPKYTKGMQAVDVKAPESAAGAASASVLNLPSLSQSASISTDSIAEKFAGASLSGSDLAPPSPPRANVSPALAFCEVLYNYQPQQPDDLKLCQGDKVAVLEHLSSDWWRGRSCGSGSEGVFPSSYVKVVDRAGAGAKSSVATPAPILKSEYPQGPGGYANPPPPQSFQAYQQVPQQQPQYYAPPPPQQYQAPPQQVVVAEQQPQGGNHNGAFKRFGSKLGNAAIFGAGATIGGDIVNSIF